ncbi:MAG: hypothetical protein JW750_10290 [Anaerolineaceae bacterium]|nr:hypothetical protein [Anaerolineaceae bacterium]
MIVPIGRKEYEKGKAIFDASARFEFIPVGSDEDEIAEFIRARDCRAVVLGVEPYRGALYESLPTGGMICRFGVGTDGVDPALSARHQLFVSNTPGVLDQSVAEHAIFLMGSLIRHITMLNEQVKRGEWLPRPAAELSDLTLAVIGLGGIGAKTARIAHQGFGMNVLAAQHGTLAKSAARLGMTEEEMVEGLGIHAWSEDADEILPQADVISLHLPVRPDTIGFFNRRRFALCKRGVLLVNTGRGRLVDESALAEALLNGQVGGAALDVFEHEPYQPGNVDLREFDQVIMTPHVASNTCASNRRMAQKVVDNLTYWADGHPEQAALVYQD